MLLLKMNVFEFERILVTVNLRHLTSEVGDPQSSPVEVCCFLLNFQKPSTDFPLKNLGHLESDSDLMSDIVADFEIVVKLFSTDMLLLCSEIERID